MAETYSNEQEKQVKRLKRKLEGWREAILPINSVLLWEKQWYPGLTFGVVTFVFLMLWLIDPNVLTTFSFFGVLITVGDLIVPMLISNIKLGGPWTGHKEKAFEDICRNIVLYYNWICQLASSLLAMRETSPKLFYSITITVLSFMTWLGGTVDNILLCYFATIAVSLFPGVQQRELPKQYLQGIFSRLHGVKNEKKDS